MCIRDSWALVHALSRVGPVRARSEPMQYRRSSRPVPAHKLSEQERQRVIDVCHEARFADLPPAHKLCRVWLKREYIWRSHRRSTAYCTQQEQRHCGCAKAPQTNKPQLHGPTAPTRGGAEKCPICPARCAACSFTCVPSSTCLAESWLSGKFVNWYKGEHLPSGLSFIMTEQRHSSLSDDVLRQRRDVYAQAQERHPLR